MSPRPPIRGIELDAQTCCAHWYSPRDIVAIKMKCCGVYYACKDCHDAQTAIRVTAATFTAAISGEG
jgi:uncharacterized CHY-type Zn-finger protein